MHRFSDRRVLVTGAASGLGRATALRLLSEGAVLCAADRDAEGLDGTRELAVKAETAGRLSLRGLDVSDEAGVQQSVGAVVEELGGLDVLINAAGIMRGAHTHECELKAWNQVITVNLTGTFLVTRAALPALLASGRGVVVNFSSTSANFGVPYSAAYAASKGGVQSFTHSIALEYAKQGLRAVSVVPGGISSGITDSIGGLLPADADWSLFAKHGAALGGGAVGAPDHVAGVVAMLASDDGAFVTGTEVRIDGGAHL